MSVLRHKIWFDVWHNKGRTAQIVLIIALGAAAIGMILGTRNLMIPEMQGQWQAIDPAMINLFINPPINEDELVALKTVEGVEEIEGFSTATIEWRVNPTDEWAVGNLAARSDYDHQKLSKLTLVSGAWPTDRLFGAEQGADTFFKIPPRGEVTLRINKKEYPVKLGGTIYNQLAAPAYFGGTAQFYTTPDRFEAMVGHKNFNEALVAADFAYSEDAAAQLADALQNKLEKQGKDSGRFITDPNKHFFQDQMDGLFFMLGALGLLALILGLLLVYNTVNAFISQQVDQIGVMKAIGARTGQILRLYLGNILVYSLLALLIALPLGAAGAWGITAWLISSFNAEPGGFSVSPSALAVQVVIVLLAPLLAAIVPIFNGARVTVREAISTYGLSRGAGLFDRLLARSKRISRLILLTFSNTFRHKWRVILLQISLILSGLMFMMVVSMKDSVAYTFGDVLFSILNVDITYVLENSERISRLEELTLAHPDVKAVEMWGLSGGNTIRPAGQAKTEDDESVLIFGVPLPTELYGYQLRGGRWLDPADTYALVLNEKLARKIGAGVGDWVTINHGGNKESTWQVVGLLFDPLINEGTSAHAPRDVMLRELGSVDKAGTVWIQTVSDNPTEQAAIAKDLRTYYDRHQVKVSAQRGVFGIGDTAAETAQLIINQFNFIVVLLGIMAVIIAAVGSIALSGSLSLSVMERRREIGVMRAIGASSWAIARLFIGEGLLLGWLSWLIALPLSIPAGRLMLQAMATAFELDLLYKYTLFGAAWWLGIITVLSVLASWLPARGAVRISVRESLAYQ